jgi:hypothetical protein
MEKPKVIFRNGSLHKNISMIDVNNAVNEPIYTEDNSNIKD